MAKEPKHYRAARDFHSDKHYPVGRSYRGPDVAKLLAEGLIEVGAGHDEPSAYDQKYSGLYMTGRQLIAKRAEGK